MNSFKIWVRNLSKAQAAIFYSIPVISLVLLIWHNPTDGYNRSLHAIKTETAQQALSGWERLAAKTRLDHHKNQLEVLRWLWIERKAVPAEGYFYMEENPWWWPYSNVSRGFNQESIPKVVREPMGLLRSFGGFMTLTGAYSLFAVLMIWLVGIRNIPANAQRQAKG